ncbi:MAG: hypothetical protein ABJP45_13685 [Cyclobacteriaceae bacterium]
MKYLKYSITGSYFPKILGTYELELHSIIMQLTDYNFRQLVIVGAGEGYYAAGLSRYLKAPAVAYERNKESLKALEELCQLNALEPIEYRGECKPASLDQLTQSLIVMDIEGEEIEFLNFGVIGKNHDCYWIIEVHGEKVKNAFTEQLDQIYELKFIACQQRSMKDFPIRFGSLRMCLFKRYWFSLMQEWRGGGPDGSLGWLVLEPKVK